MLQRQDRLYFKFLLASNRATDPVELILCCWEAGISARVLAFGRMKLTWEGNRKKEQGNEAPTSNCCRTGSQCPSRRLTSNHEKTSDSRRLELQWSKSSASDGLEHMVIANPVLAQSVFHRNAFACNVNETLLLSTARALVSLGLRDLGYNYVVLDDCWSAGRNASGYLVEDPEKFPSVRTPSSVYLL